MPTPEQILDRLHGLHPRLIDLSLDRLLALLAKLGNPHLALPPIIHVAGTNGKGSTCAFLRAMAEAAGLRVHVYTSPHLVTFNERIRLAGHLVTDDALSAAFDEVEKINAAAPITVFEVITAAAFLLFARTFADLVILEVGLGGRGDATNVVTPVVCAIASISLDHQELLGETLSEIAAEKAGIIKPGVPVVTGLHAPEILAVLEKAAADKLASLLIQGRDWRLSGTTYIDAAATIDLSTRSLPGPHQLQNAALAAAAIRAANLPIPPTAITEGAATAAWPARMQRLHGRLAALIPPDWELWLDGGHNEGAAKILAEILSTWQDRPVHLIIGMKQSKDPAAFLAPLIPYATTIHATKEPNQHQAMQIEAIIAASNGCAYLGPDTRTALSGLTGRKARVLICGSLHLAGEVIKLDTT